MQDLTCVYRSNTLLNKIAYKINKNILITETKDFIFRTSSKGK